MTKQELTELLESIVSAIGNGVSDAEEEADYLYQELKHNPLI
jgi:hypothetical protein